METRPTATRPRPPSSLYAVKPRFVAALEGVRTRLIRRGVSADQVSVAAIGVAGAASLMIVAGNWHRLAWLGVLPLCVLWMALNALDGSIARATHQESRRGALLNEAADRTGDLFILLAGFTVAPWFVSAAALALVGAAELVGAVGWAVNGRRVLDGPMPKPDRAILIGVGATIATVAPTALGVTYAVVAAGAGAGAVARARRIWDTAATMDGDEGQGHGR